MIVVPTYNMILAADATLFYPLDQLRRTAGSSGVTVGEKVTLIVAKENKNLSELQEDDFYPIGVTGVISEINQQGYVTIRTNYRVNIEDVRIYPDHSIRLMTSRRADIDDLDKNEEKEKVRALVKEMREYTAGLQWAESAEYFIKLVDSLGFQGGEYGNRGEM